MTLIDEICVSNVFSMIELMSSMLSKIEVRYLPSSSKM
jgi:hypothetical protein